MNETKLETLKLEEILLKTKKTSEDFYFKSTLQIIGITEKLTYKGDPYFELFLREKTNEIKCRKFINTESGENHETIAKILAVGNIIKFVGRFQKNYNSILIYEVKKLSPNEFNLSDFVLPSTIKVSKLISRLDEIISEIKEKKLKQLLEKILSDEDLKIKFIKCPSSIKGHHSYKYGNIEHTISMIEIFKTLEKFYEQETLVNIDLIYTGIILHDIGKIYEYSIINDVPKINPDARLIGHIILGDRLVVEYVDKIQDFPKD